MVKWIIGALIGVVVMICAFLIIDPRTSLISTNSVKTSSESLTTINVEIDGAVVNPGTYTVNSNATLQDLIDEAGGLLSSADFSCFETSISVENYELFYIPYEAGYAEECVPVTETKININSASTEEIATINGISETLAEKIVEYRETNGQFQTLEEVMNVTGIGIKTYEKIRDYICLK